MSKMNMSNSLWNDDAEGIIAFAEQIKDKKINWTDPDFADKIPAEFKTEASKFQSPLNNLFLKHYAEFKRFLEDPGLSEGVIDSWKELADFLAGISDEEGITLMNIARDLQIASGQLNVRMSEETPGTLEAVTTQDSFGVDSSYIDESGAIKVVFTYG